jgi:hypothetical protein
MKQPGWELFMFCAHDKNVREWEFFFESHFSEKKCIIRKISIRMATGAVNVYLKPEPKVDKLFKKKRKGMIS